MGKKVGNLIKKARTDAGMTQEQLAKKVKGVSASDISAAERGIAELTTQNLKDIAKATGVTQASLLNANTSSKSTKKTTTTRTTNAKTTGAKSSMQVTATERKLINYYREADSNTKKKVMSMLKGTDGAELLGEVVETAIQGVFKAGAKAIKGTADKKEK